MSTAETEMGAQIALLVREIAALREDLRQSAALVAAAQLVAVDAARSEVYARLMDEQLSETTSRLVAGLARTRTVTD